MATKRLWAAVAAFAVVGLLYAAPSSMAASPDDFAGPEAFSVLPPGQDGSLAQSVHSSDQIPLYDGLTPKFDNITASDLPNHFKRNVFGLDGQTPERVENPPARPGVTIERDSFGVPHVTASAREDVMYGAGWIAYEDRGFFMDLLRSPGKLAAIDAPGVDPFALAFQFRTFTPTAQTNDFLNSQVELLQDQGPGGVQVLADIDNYVEGINGYRSFAGTFGAPWTREDVLGVAALIGSIFGRGGGDEARRSQLLDGLQQRIGAGPGQRLFNDLTEQQDPETSVSLPDRFKYDGPNKQKKGNAVIDDGTWTSTTSLGPEPPPAAMSNALLVGASRSTNGHPLFVAGPQVGYFYPQALMEMDLHGGGIDARGVVFPGSAPYVLIGRGKDYAWSATSAGSDIIDEYVEELCGDDTHYRHNGRCVEMEQFDAGVLGPGGGNPTQHVSFPETVHGPVVAYGEVNGRRVAISQKRSTRGREVLSALGFVDLNENKVESPESFYDTANKIEFTFNWFYADHEHIAMFSSGRLPIRRQQVDSSLPTKGTGKYEWRGFEGQNDHPHGDDPPSGVIVNWNNKPAPGFSAADDQWAYGSVHRNNLLEDAVAREDQHSMASLVAAMNRAATQDLRTARVLPSLKAVLETGPAPSPRDQQMLDLLQQWRDNGSSRIDVDENGRIDDPGAAVMDTAWPLIADAVMSPVLGPQLSQLAGIMTRDQRPNNQGSSYASGWYGYVDKDLRTLLGQPVEGKFVNRFCGQGDLDACRDSLWAAIHAAGEELELQQGTADPNEWRSSSGPERIRFQPTFLMPTSMRWTNRPTFQQAISFSGHR